MKSDPEGWAPPITVSLVMLAIMFLPWRWIFRVAVLTLGLYLGWTALKEVWAW